MVLIQLTFETQRSHVYTRKLARHRPGIVSKRLFDGRWLMSMASQAIADFQEKVRATEREVLLGALCFKSGVFQNQRNSDRNSRNSKGVRCAGQFHARVGHLQSGQ